MYLPALEPRGDLCGPVLAAIRTLRRAAGNRPTAPTASAGRDKRERFHQRRRLRCRRRRLAVQRAVRARGLHESAGRAAEDVILAAVRRQQPPGRVDALARGAARQYCRQAPDGRAYGARCRAACAGARETPTYMICGRPWTSPTDWFLGRREDRRGGEGSGKTRSAGSSVRNGARRVRRWPRWGQRTRPLGRRRPARRGGGTWLAGAAGSSAGGWSGGAPG